MAAETRGETTQRSRQENTVAEIKTAKVVGTEVSRWIQRHPGREGGIRGHTQIPDPSQQVNLGVKGPCIGTQLSTSPAQTPTAAHHGYQRPTVLGLTGQSEVLAEVPQRPINSPNHSTRDVFIVINPILRMRKLRHRAAHKEVRLQSLCF